MRARYAILLLLIGILLLSLGFTLYQVNRVFLHTQTRQSSSWSSQLQVHGLLKEAINWRSEEMEELKGTVSSLEKEIKKGSFEEESVREFPERDSKQRLTAASLKFFPLKGKTSEHGDSHYFMSLLKGRGLEKGPPEFFLFPQGAHEPRLLCLRGNHSSDGAKNSYALAFKEEVPTGVHLLPGITLLSDTYWDFNNPWHSVFSLLQFVYWHIDNRCSQAKNLFLFHRGEYRTSMGNWIKSILKASGLPSTPSSIDVLARTNSHVSNGATSPTVCFEQAVVSRSGIAGMKLPLRTRMIREASCQARRACNISFNEGEFTNHKRLVNITLIVRKGARGYLDELAWQHVVKEQCEAALHCNWSVMYVANLSFCEQVEAMSHTNIVMSVHGAQLANLIFMPPGGRVMEMFPFGWLELAGRGQYVYRHVSEWVGLQHEGYWRDPSTPPCPNPSDKSGCFSHYKEQALGINVTYIENWLRDVIKRYQDSSLDSSHLHHNNPNVCECRKR